VANRRLSIILSGTLWRAALSVNSGYLQGMALAAVDN
jgi:hypothetical protein